MFPRSKTSHLSLKNHAKSLPKIPIFLSPKDCEQDPITALNKGSPAAVHTFCPEYGSLPCSRSKTLRRCRSLSWEAAEVPPFRRRRLDPSWSTYCRVYHNSPLQSARLFSPCCHPIHLIGPQYISCLTHEIFSTLCSQFCLHKTLVIGGDDTWSSGAMTQQQNVRHESFRVSATP